MTGRVGHMTAPAPGGGAERNLWLPPGRMRRYHLARAVGGLLVAVIFVGWMAIQWSNPVMRILTAALLMITAWVTVSSILADVRRARGRQVMIEGDVLTIVTPESRHEVRLHDVAHAEWRDSPTPSPSQGEGRGEGRVNSNHDAAVTIHDKKHTWTSAGQSASTSGRAPDPHPAAVTGGHPLPERERGLDAGLTFFDHHRPLATIDLNILADQSEARAFLCWARSIAKINFEVRWPDSSQA